MSLHEIIKMQGENNSGKMLEFCSEIVGILEIFTTFQKVGEGTAL